VTPAEFEERAYEAPLYDQLQGDDPRLFNPGQVLENKLGFDRGLFIAQKALWKLLGRKAPPGGAFLANYNWPGKNAPQKEKFPPYRLNLFLQAKRPHYCQRKPRVLRSITSVDAPLWAFPIKYDQQRLLERLAERTKRSCHVAYAAGAFHTYSSLFTHTLGRTIVKNSTFPSAQVLAGHEFWYYQKPGAEGIANPEPDNIREQPLFRRLFEAATKSNINESNGLDWMESLATATIDSARNSEGSYSRIRDQFFQDLRTLDSLRFRYDLEPSLQAYVQVQLFATRFPTRLAGL
jgi:hypothetical protein